MLDRTASNDHVTPPSSGAQGARRSRADDRLDGRQQVEQVLGLHRELDFAVPSDSHAEFECRQVRDLELPYATDGLLMAKRAQRSEERCRLIGLWNHHECLDRSGHWWASDRRSNVWRVMTIPFAQVPVSRE